MNYARALLYEFSLTNRDGMFINNVIQVKFTIFVFFINLDQKFAKFILKNSLTESKNLIFSLGLKL